MKELTSKENKQDNQRTVNQFNNTVAPVHTKNSLSLPSIIDQANKDKKGPFNSNTIGLPGKAKDSLIQRSIIEQANDSSIAKQNALSDNKSGSFDEIKDVDSKITTNETIILPEVSTSLNFSVGAPNSKYPDAVINFSADVKYVQNRLLEIGLLSGNDHLNEYPKSEPKVDNNTDVFNSTNELSGSENLMISLYKRIGVGPQVSSVTIPKTIEAIKVFQKEVKHGKNIDGRIDLGSTANLLANITKGQVIKLMVEYRSKKRQNEEKKKEALTTHKNSDEFKKFEENRIKNIKAISSGEESVKGIIDNHKSESDLACLLRDYAEHNPTLVIKILEASDYSDQDDIVLEMMRIIDDNLLSKLSTELLGKMKEFLEEGWTDDKEDFEIKRINSGLKNRESDKSKKIKGSITHQDLVNAANELGIELAAMLAISANETGNQGSFGKDGKAAILFERHKMYNKLKSGGYDVNSLKKGNEDIINNIQGGYGKYRIQHEKLERAKKINKDIAIESASWGKFQIMGENFRWGGYRTASEMEKAMNESELEHLKFFIQFLKNKSNGKIILALNTHNWEDVAYHYNGSKWKETNPNYANDLKEHYDRFKKAGY